MSIVQLFDFSKDFTYRFVVDDIDSGYLHRVEAAMKRSGGVILKSDFSEIVVRVSVAALSPSVIVRLLSPSRLMLSEIAVHHSADNRASVVVKSPTRKIAVRGFFILVSLILIVVLLKQGDFKPLTIALPVMAALYLMASRLPPTGEYPRLRKFLIGQKE